jgi:hypothetical protein
VSSADYGNAEVIGSYFSSVVTARVPATVPSLA